MRRSALFLAVVSCSAGVASIDGCVSDDASVAAVDGGGGTDSAVANDTSVTPPLDAGGDTAIPVDAAPWTPAALPGLVMWLSAEDLTGTKVSAWADRSGNSNNAAQATAANQPTLLTGANGINNLPAVRFDGVASILTVNDVVSLQLGTGDFRMALAARSSGQDAGLGYGLLMEKHLPEAGMFDGFSFHITSGSVDGFVRLNVGVPDNGVFDDNTTHIFGMYRVQTVNGSASGVLGIGIDGTAAPKENALAASIDVSGLLNPLTIGARLNPDGGTIPTQLLKGDIAEIVLIKGNASETGVDVKNLYTYLKTKYAVP